MGVKNQFKSEKGVYLFRHGEKSKILLKRSFMLSKFLTYNTYTMPNCRRMRIVFPLFEVEGTLRSKGIIIMLEFLEQMTGLRALITKAHLIVNSGLWVRGQVDLADFNFMKFISFFNEFFLSHPLLRFSLRLPSLRAVNKNYVKLVISEIDVFFDAFTRRGLPHSKHYWLEIDFFFDNNFELPKEVSITFYTQFFFSHNLFEWRKI